MRRIIKIVLKSIKKINGIVVSIIIPSYNRASTVGQTIDSILAQQCDFNIEIIIGDDCSTDNVIDILLDYQEKYPEIIKLIFHKKNIGLAANWATCVKECKGKYICNCDNDDYWHNPDKLQLQVDFMESNPNYGVIHTNYRTHNRSTGEIKECNAYIDEMNDSMQSAFFTGKYQVCNATMMYRKEMLYKYLPLDDYIKYQFTLQDWNTWIILAAYTKFYCFPISTATFGIETDSITRPKTYEQLENRLSQEKSCYKYVCDMFPQNLKFDENGYDAYMNFVLLNLAYKKLDFSSAKKYAQKCYELGERSKKVKYARFAPLFYMFAIMKEIRN